MSRVSARAPSRAGGIKPCRLPSAASHVSAARRVAPPPAIAPRHAAVPIADDDVAPAADVHGINISAVPVLDTSKILAVTIVCLDCGTSFDSVSLVIFIYFIYFMDLCIMFFNFK